MSMTERSLRSAPSSGRMSSLRMSSAPSSGRTSSIRSTLSLPKAFKRSGYASSIASYESTDLNAISEDHMMDSVVASPKVIPPVIDEEPRASVRSMTSKQGLKESRSSSRMSELTTLSAVETEDSTISGTGTPKKGRSRVSFTGANIIDDFSAPLAPKLTNGISVDDTASKAADMENSISMASSVDEMKTPPETMSPEPASLDASASSGKADSAGERTTDVSQATNPTTLNSASAIESGLEEDVNAPRILTEDIGDYDPNIMADLMAARALADYETELDHEYLAEHEVPKPGFAVSRKPVDSAATISQSLPIEHPAVPADADSRDRSQNPELRHPTPRSVRPADKILKTASPALDHRNSRARLSKQASTGGRPATIIRAASPPRPRASTAAMAAAASASHQPTADELAEIDALRQNATSASSFTREDANSKTPTKQRGASMKTSMRESQVPSMRGGTGTRGFGRPVPSQKAIYKQQLEEMKQDPRVLEQLRPSNVQESIATSYVSMQRSNSVSSFKKEKEKEHTSIVHEEKKAGSFGFKRFTIGHTTPKKSRVASTTESAPPPPPPVLNGLSPASAAPAAAGSTETATTTTTTTTTTTAQPSTIVSRGFSQLPSNHPFSLETEETQVFSTSVSTAPPTAYETGTADATHSFDSPVSPAKSDRDRENALAQLTGSILPPKASVDSTQFPEVTQSTEQTPVTPAKQKKMSQYQQFKIERAQRKEMKNNKHITQVAPALPAQTAAAALAMSGSARASATATPVRETAPSFEYSDTPISEKSKKKKFGGLRKLFKLDE